MAKKIQPDDFKYFESLHRSFIKIPTWTKEKKAYKKKIFDFLNRFNSETIIRNWNYKKLNNGIRYKKWEYENTLISGEILGYFKKYRNEYVFIFCIETYSVYALKKLLVIPSDYKEVVVYKKEEK
jgi:hypothetical protein